MGRKNSWSVGGRMISRRDFLRLAGGATGAASVGLLTSCRPETTTAGATGETPEASEGRHEVGSGAGQGRLLARSPPLSPDAEVPTGLQPLGLGSGRDGLLYVPEGYGQNEETPLALTLHGAGGNARGAISHFLD